MPKQNTSLRTKICALKALGYTTTRIAEELGVAVSSVTSVLSNRRTQGRSPKNDAERDTVELYSVERDRYLMAHRVIP